MIVCPVRKDITGNRRSVGTVCHTVSLGHTVDVILSDRGDITQINLRSCGRDCSGMDIVLIVLIGDFHPQGVAAVGIDQGIGTVISIGDGRVAAIPLIGGGRVEQTVGVAQHGADGAADGGVAGDDNSTHIIHIDDGHCV